MTTSKQTKTKTVNANDCHFVNNFRLEFGSIIFRVRVVERSLNERGRHGTKKKDLANVGNQFF